MKQHLLFFITAILFTSFSFGQSKQFDITNARDGESVEYCITHKKMNALQKNAAFLKIHAADQALLKKREEEIRNERLSTKKPAGIVYTIPIVFHVLHNGGQENISREQILDAVSILNRDFRLQNTDANNVVAAFQGMPTDVEIEFVLATKAPNGACFGGITRTQNALTDDGSSGTAQVNAIVNGNDVYNGQWPGDEYLNIFVCNEIGGAAGYTMNPFSTSWGGAQMGNGIFVLEDYVGSIGTSGVSTSRTLTHEVGHWLNLSHTWGSNNNPGNASSCSTDDGVTDTPNTIGVTACVLGENTCGPLANVENYMDYSYCSKMFTQGQVDRMRAALTSSVANRNNLWTTSNLTATGANTAGTACAAVFSAPKVLLCAGESITFADESYNNISGWNWTFTGGTPSSSTTQNPTITYSTPGTYSVTLQATDGSSTVSLTKTAYISVLPAPGASLPVAEGFENASSLPNSDWFIDNPDNSNAWNVTSLAASTGSKSLRLYNYGNQDGDIDEFISTTYDLSNMASVTVSFKYAFAKKSSANTDKLQFLASYNCGDTWLVRKSVSSSQLPTSGNTTTNFIPNSTEWNEVTVTNLTSTYFVDNFRFKFTFFSGGGNNVYIDDINIWGVDNNGNNVGAANMTGIQELFSADAMLLYPNPTAGNTTLSFGLADRSDNLEVALLDMVGKEIAVIHRGALAAGEHQFNISTENLSTGVYFVTINSDGKSLTKKLIIE